MTRVKIVKLKPNAVLPAYQTEHAAGMDLHACIDGPQTLQPFERALIPTGLAIELPTGLEAQIRARSGLSIKNGITMVNGVGTIDSDYRGEVGMLVINLGNEPFVIEPGMRVAQMVISSFERIIWDESTTINLTERDRDGYGSTGGGL
jgi:dUTP pyrophosphatase